MSRACLPVVTKVLTGQVSHENMGQKIVKPFCYRLLNFDFMTDMVEHH